MLKKYKGSLFKEDDSAVLKEPREKWFKGEDGAGHGSIMAQAFDNTIVSWQIWEMMRKLTCVICGQQYVRHLPQVENPEVICKVLCQTVYDLRKAFLARTEAVV